MQLDENLFIGSHDTVIIGWNKKNEVIFIKGYFYDKQGDEAQSDLKKIIDAGLIWRITHTSLLKFESND